MNELQAKNYPTGFVKGVVKGDITPRYFIWDESILKYKLMHPTFNIVLTKEQYDEMFPLPKDTDISPENDTEARCVKQKKTIEMFEECYKNGSEPPNWLKLLFGVDIHIDHPILMEYRLWKKVHEDILKEFQTKIPRSFVFAILDGSVLPTHFQEEMGITKQYRLNSAPLIKAYGILVFTEEELKMLFPDMEADRRFSKVLACDSSDRMYLAVTRAARMVLRIANAASVSVDHVLYGLVKFNHQFANVSISGSGLINDAEVQYKEYLEMIHDKFNVMDS